MRGRLANGLGACAFLLSTFATAVTFVVDSTNDTVDANPGDGVAEDGSGDTTLRAAIMEANALAGDDDITLPAGTYTLSIGGTDEDAAATGDLDITSNIAINGAGSATTIISGNDIDRVFHVMAGASLVINDVTIRDGLAQGSLDLGGGILNLNGALETNDSVIRENAAEQAAGIGSIAFSGGTATLTMNNTVVTMNAAGLNAGAIGIGAQSFGAGSTTANTTIENCTVSDNSAVDISSGITNSASGSMAVANLIVTDSTIDANNSPLQTAVGGGITNSSDTDGVATVDVMRSTISNHEEPGGGLWNTSSGGSATTTVVNSTISGNRVYDDEFLFQGGGITNESINDVSAIADMTVRNSTITNNQTVELLQGSGGFGAGGIFNRQEQGTATFTLENTIVAGNIATGPNTDAEGTFVGNANNLIGDTTGSSGFSGSDLLNVDPVLGALADNGGPTLTHAIPVNSPARNAGDNTGAPATDQRGFARIVNGVIDIGAFEFQGLNPVFVDFAFGGTELGTLSNPFNTVVEGVGAASSGATVNFDAGATSETLTINQAVTLQSTGGSVFIGSTSKRSTPPKSIVGFVSPE